MNLDTFAFMHMYAFWILLLLLVLIFISTISKSYEDMFSKEMLSKIVLGKNTKKLNFILMFMAFILIVMALARPVLKNEPINVSQNDLSIMVAFDISRSMQSEDVYPNRLAFAKNKFYNLLANLKDEKIGALGFSSRSFLIAPITNDYASLQYLVKNVSTKYISVNGSDVFEALKSTNNLLKNKQEKALIVFTDGTDSYEFTKEIDFANENNIRVFVYAIATQKGGVIKTEDGVVKDSDGNIVITKLNNSIKDLAFRTNGAYLEYSSSKNDIKEFINLIRQKFDETKDKKKEIIINTNQELFYFPLGLALVFVFISISGFRRGVK